MGFRYHHLHLVCSDLEKLIRFFTEDLGAGLVCRRKFGTADGATLDLDGVRVNLRVARQGEEIAGDSAQTRYGYDHLGLEVEDLQAVYQELVAKGYRFFIPPTETEDVWMAFFKGPDNITVELVQPKA
jgi:catechol 2,3-dioxygenase-like lactoylglutathione lyase family enzyme